MSVRGSSSLTFTRHLLAVAVAGPFGEPEDHGQIANDPPSEARRPAHRAETRLAIAYEAGPTGHALHRQFTSLGVRTRVRPDVALARLRNAALADPMSECDLRPCRFRGAAAKLALKLR